MFVMHVATLHARECPETKAAKTDATARLRRLVGEFPRRLSVVDVVVVIAASSSNAFALIGARPKRLTQRPFEQQAARIALLEELFGTPRRGRSVIAATIAR